MIEAVLKKRKPLPPPPDIVHANVTDDSTGHRGSRFIFIGDVHGCLEELKGLLDHIGFCRARDKVVCIGDVVNKGPLSIETVRYLRDIGALAVRGNHDNRVILAYDEWKSTGQHSNPAYAYVSGFPDDDMSWLKQLPYTLSVPCLNCVAVHAGLAPHVPLDSQDQNNMTEMREIRGVPGGDGDGVEVLLEPDEGSQPWGSAWPGPQWVVYGHDAKRGLQEHPMALGLDTGCVYGKALTAAVVDVPPEPIGTSCRPTYRLVSVPARQVYQQPTGDDK